MGFLNDDGVTTLWSRIRNYMTGGNVKTLTIDGATNVDEALTALNTELTTQSEQIASFHNSVFRGKNLGAFDETWATRISDGTFDNMFLGDYFESSFVRRNQSGDAIDTVTIRWRIWGFDWFLHKGSTELTQHHVVILPDQALGTIRMNATDTTEGAYADTELRNNGRNTVQDQIISAFTVSETNYVITYKDLLTKAVFDGQSSNWDWYDCCVEVPSDVMLTGTKHWGNGYDIGCHSILPLAAITQKYVVAQDDILNGDRQSVVFWLRSVVSALNFSCLSDYGSVDCEGAASASDVWFRPYFLLA